MLSTKLKVLSLLLFAGLPHRRLWAGSNYAGCGSH